MDPSSQFTSDEAPLDVVSGGDISDWADNPLASSSAAGFFSSVPWWAWAILGGVVLLKVIR